MPLPTSTSRQTPIGFSPTVATVDLGALAQNVAIVRKTIPPGCQILAVVKADAYGHGMLPIAKALARQGIGRFAVANVAEGMALREGGLRAPILVMGALFSEQLTDVLRYDLTPVLHEPAVARELAELVTKRKAPCPVHVKIDTGMGRLGLRPEAAQDFLQSPIFKGALRLEGLMTHLADADGQDPSYTRLQLSRFAGLVQVAKAAGLSIPLVHAANSAAILDHRDACFTAVRPGLMLYGYHTTQHRPDLKPVLSLTSHIAQVRTIAAGEAISYNRTYLTRSRSRIAVVPVGYADGYSRAYSNRGAMLIHGQEAPVVGRVCMDMTMVDVTHIPEAQRGDPVVLIGRQGNKALSAQDLAAWQGTIPYEVLCGIGPRARRAYVTPPPRRKPKSGRRG